MLHEVRTASQESSLRKKDPKLASAEPAAALPVLDSDREIPEALDSAMRKAVPTQHWADVAEALRDAYNTRLDCSEEAARQWVAYETEKYLEAAVQRRLGQVKSTFAKIGAGIVTGATYLFGRIFRE